MKRFPLPAFRRQALPFVLLSALAAPSAAGVEPVPAAPSVHIPFIEGRPWAEVLKKAKAEKKPILLDVVAAWCGPCKIMDATTFSDMTVVDWAKKKVVPARYDAEKGEGRKIAARYLVRSFPTVILLDAEGNEIDRMLGAVPTADFIPAGDKILQGKTRIQEAFLDVQKTWNLAKATSLARAYADRNDLKHLRPIAIRGVNEDPDLTQPETLDLLYALAAVEEQQGKLSSETADLLQTYWPRVNGDQRQPSMAIIVAREQSRRGDAAGTRATAEAAIKLFGESSPYGINVLISVGLAEKKVGKREAAIVAFQRALKAANDGATQPIVKAAIQIELAELQAEAGKKEEARSNVSWALTNGGNDVGLLARASSVYLKLNTVDDALAQAKKAVGLSEGTDAQAQASLAAALAAAGDSPGAEAAWKRAAEIDPDNPEYKKPLPGKKGGAKAS